MIEHRISHIRNTFIAGLLTLVPISVTLFLVVWFFDLLTGRIPMFLDLLPHSRLKEVVDNRIISFFLRVISLGLLLFCIWLMGLIARNVAGRRLIQSIERLLLKLPMVRTIYSTVQQIGQAVFNGTNTGMFRKVVLIEYPRKNVYAIGFVTATEYTECSFRAGCDLVAVFLPTTPNPTSGFLLFVPAEDVLALEMSVTDAMRLIISGGVVRPPFAKEKLQAPTVPIAPLEQPGKDRLSSA